MNETEIRRYAGLMQELGLTGLEITEDNKVVRLERTAPPAAREAILVDGMSAFSQAASMAGENAGYGSPAAGITGNAAYGAPAASAMGSAGTSSVTSPLVGIFYAASAENAAPYVAIGDQVKKGQILCLIEAMKLMNEVTAEEDGVISEICVTNGQVVEYGTELFRIRKQA